MTPVDIGDTQGTLQARKTFKTAYKRPETLVWVYINTSSKSERNDSSRMRTACLPTARGVGDYGTGEEGYSPGGGMALEGIWSWEVWPWRGGMVLEGSMALGREGYGTALGFGHMEGPPPPPWTGRNLWKHYLLYVLVIQYSGCYCQQVAINEFGIS